MLEALKPQTIFLDEDGTWNFTKEQDISLPVSSEESEDYTLDRIELLSSLRPYTLKTMPRTGGVFALYFTKPAKHGYVYVGKTSNIKNYVRKMRSGQCGDAIDTVWKVYGAPQVYVLSECLDSDDKIMKGYSEKLHCEFGRYAQAPRPTTDKKLLEKRQDVLDKALYKGHITDFNSIRGEFTQGVYILQFPDGRIYVGSASTTIPNRWETHLWHENSKSYREKWTDSRRLYHEWKRMPDGYVKAYVITTDDTLYRQHEKDYIRLLRPELNEKL